MKSLDALMIYGAILSCLIVFVIWKFFHNMELGISISLRVMSFVLAVYYIVKYKEWKIIFLAAMFLLMAMRQIATFLIWAGYLEVNETTRALSEIPGFMVTLLGLLSIIYIGNILSGNMRIIQGQREDINTLAKLLPLCARCKKIRDSSGYWKEIDAYIESHTDSKVSHGLCESCSDELYGDQDWYKKMKQRNKE